MKKEKEWSWERLKEILPWVLLAAGVVTAVIIMTVHMKARQIQTGLGIGISALNAPDKASKKEWTGDRIYFGDIEWRILSVDSDKIFLLADHIPDIYKDAWTGMPYQETNQQYNWIDSNIRLYLNSELYKDGFTDIEKAAFLSGDGDERLFVLTQWEATNTLYGMGAGYEPQEARQYDMQWWLKDDWNSDNGLCYIGLDGGLYKDGNPNDTDSAIRPACLLNSSALVFTAPADMERKLSLSGELETFGNANTSRAWTAALSSENQYLSIDSIGLDGNVCSLTYSNAAIGDGNSISAIVTDGIGSRVYAYGKIADTSTQGAGTAEIHLPKGYKSDYRLLVFSEQDNPGYMTDYASEPVAILDGNIPAANVEISKGSLSAASVQDDILIVNYAYDSYLFWKWEDYERADDPQKLMAATAALMYTAMQEYGMESLSLKDVEGAETYVRDHPEEALGLIEIVLDTAKKKDTTLKEEIEAACQPVQNKADGERTVDIGEYGPYLDYNSDMFSKAAKEEQEKVMVAFFLYGAKYRKGIEYTEEELNQAASDLLGSPETLKQLKRAIDQILKISPDKTLREIYEGM